MSLNNSSRHCMGNFKVSNILVKFKKYLTYKYLQGGYLNIEHYGFLTLFLLFWSKPLTSIKNNGWAFFDKLAKAMAVTFFEWIFLCTYMIAWLVSKNDVKIMRKSQTIKLMFHIPLLFYIILLGSAHRFLLPASVTQWCHLMYHCYTHLHCSSLDTLPVYHWSFLLHFSFLL